MYCIKFIINKSVYKMKATIFLPGYLEFISFVKLTHIHPYGSESSLAKGGDPRCFSIHNRETAWIVTLG